MPLLIDASVVAAWAFEEEHAIAESAFARVRAEEAVVPVLWWYELRNVLVLGERWGRLTEQQTARFLRRIARLRISLDQTLDETAVLTLELAVRRGLPLATLD